MVTCFLTYNMSHENIKYDKMNQIISMSPGSTDF